MKSERQMSVPQALFTIDLLNGRALPLKGKPGGLAVIAVSATVPIAVAIGLIGLYLHNNTAVAAKEKEIAHYQAEIGKLSEAVQLKAALEKEKNACKNYLSDVSSSIKRHTQWSPILTTLIENMPDSVVLTNIEVEQKSVKKKVPKPDDPQKTVEIDVLVKTLRLRVSSGSQRNCDEAIRDFRDRLRASAILGPRLENIAVAQESETRQGHDVVSYEISCVFKPES
ncbi:MAG TPA: hypothetical protein VMW24_01425 [Sedimentisphaerales bacterium]|nr:hypothetical protein [Sedimentisphaerales bacterium]